VESYNVIGEIEGKDPSKTVIISSLYDSWWTQGTADSAISIGMLLTMAKYYKELKTNYDITPENNIKFIAFGGEEFGYLGAKHYESAHSDEDIVAVIDLNQLGFTQTDPRLTMDLCTNKILFAPKLQRIADNSNYVERTGDAADQKVWPMPFGGPSNDQPFASNRILQPLTTVSFFKDRAWVLHHRDGRNHTEGDVMKYYNETDVAFCVHLSESRSNNYNDIYIYFI
jgi:hypothetical protein